MKRIAFLIVLGFSISTYAQTKQVTEETTTTKVTVNDGTGKPKTITKVEKTEAQQDIKLKDAKSKKLNKDIEPSPVEVTKTTSIETDGFPTYYIMNGQKYRFQANKDKSVYRVSSPDNYNYAVIHRTPSGRYIYTTNGTTSIGSFDDDGNFIIETYNDKSDNVVAETYRKLDDMDN